jgi:anthranilate synthase component 1
LQSTAPGPAIGRFDILLAFPGAQLVADRVGPCSGFLKALDARWSSEKTIAVESSLPFHGGWFLYLGYELAGEVEPTLILDADSVLPGAVAVRCPAAIIRDHDRQKTIAVCEDSVAELIDVLRKDVLEVVRAGPHGEKRPAEIPRITEDDASRFVSAWAGASVVPINCQSCI